MGKLDDVLAAAKAGAADQGAGTALVQTSGSTGGSNLPATNMSTEAFLNGGGMDVDGYVAVNEFGIRLNKNWKGFLDDFEATIDLSEVVRLGRSEVHRQECRVRQDLRRYDYRAGG